MHPNSSHLRVLGVPLSPKDSHQKSTFQAPGSSSVGVGPPPSSPGTPNRSPFEFCDGPGWLILRLERGLGHQKPSGQQIGVFIGCFCIAASHGLRLGPSPGRWVLGSEVSQTLLESEGGLTPPSRSPSTPTFSAAQKCRGLC